MIEREIERRLCRMVRERSGITYKFTSPNAPGVPDRIVITRRGVVWFVELKTTHGKLTVIQKRQIAELSMHNANVRVLYGWDAAKEFVDEVMPDEA
jgi:Holliday junction resolvase